MNIEVELFYDFVKHLPHGSKNRKCSLTLREGSTIQELLDILGLPPKIPKIILVNGVRPQDGRRLQGNDVVAIFPPIAGG
jgi:sulfur carrier protein ThiS